MQNYILLTKVLGIDSEAEEQQEKFGLKGDVPERWLDIAIDLRSVIAVRENYFIKDDTVSIVTLYTAIEAFDVLGDFKEVYDRWRKVKNES